MRRNKQFGNVGNLWLISDATCGLNSPREDVDRGHCAISYGRRELFLARSQPPSQTRRREREGEEIAHRKRVWRGPL
jgi:hypothetical protein